MCTAPDLATWPTAADAARALNVTKARVLALDARLEPVRDARGHRRYDPARLAAYATEHAARRSAYLAHTDEPGKSADGNVQP